MIVVVKAKEGKGKEKVKPKEKQRIIYKEWMNQKKKINKRKGKQVLSTLWSNSQQ